MERTVLPFSQKVLENRKVFGLVIPNLWGNVDEMPHTRPTAKKKKEEKKAPRVTRNRSRVSDGESGAAKADPGHGRD